MKSNFTYSFDMPNRRILIIDMNLGGKSVTNDIENVIERIKSDAANISSYQVRYLDSEGIITEVILDDNGNFKSFGEDKVNEIL